VRMSVFVTHCRRSGWIILIVPVSSLRSSTIPRRRRVFPFFPSVLCLRFLCLYRQLRRLWPLQPSLRLILLIRWECVLRMMRLVRLRITPTRLVTLMMLAQQCQQCRSLRRVAVVA
jgi:hypothetical protein